MEFKDLLLKIANNERLTPHELDVLGRFGSDTQQRNAQVASIYNGAARLSISELRANRLYIGNEQYSGIAARYQNINQTIATTTYVDANVWAADYADFGFSTDGTSIRIPETGRYQVIFQVSWAHNTTGTRDCGAQTNGAPDRPQTNKPASAMGYTYLNAIDELEYTAGDLIKLTMWQDSGGNLSFDAWIVFRKIR